MNLSFDIFGMPVPVTVAARRGQLERGIKAAFALGMKLQFFYSPAMALTDCLRGFVSPNTAVKLLFGEASYSCYRYLRSFHEFLDTVSEDEYKYTFKILELWQNRKNVVPENTFLFPLVEPGSNLLDSSL